MNEEARRKEQEFLNEYMRRGYTRAQARNMARQRAERWMVRELKQNHPEVFARVREVLRAEEEAKEQQRQEELRRQELLHLAARRADNAMVCTGMPLPEVAAEDFIAFRAWSIQSDGSLRGVGVGEGYTWREVNFADREPAECNTSGFHAVRIDPHGLIAGRAGYYLSVYACVGLVRLAGTIVEHEDGWYRAEFAQILCIWYSGDRIQSYIDVPQLYTQYPTTPVYVCSRRQATEALFVIGALGFVRGGAQS